MLQSFMYLHTTDFLPICTHFHTHTHTHAHPSHAHAHPLTSTCTPLTYICHHPLTYTCTPLTCTCTCTPLTYIFVYACTHAHTQTKCSIRIFFLFLFPLFNRLLSNLPKCHCCSQDPYRLALPGSGVGSSQVSIRHD